MLLTAGWAVAFGGPSLPFDASDTAAPPDYADAANWAALPQRIGVEDSIPAGIGDTDIQATAPVDVFFIHPTGYLAGDSWTFSMDPNTKAEENTQWMMANQASAYNGCCKVYAPRYRQANIFAYFRGDDIRKQALGFAYQDVRALFNTFCNITARAERLSSPVTAKARITAYAYSKKLLTAHPWPSGWSRLT